MSYAKKEKRAERNFQAWHILQNRGWWHQVNRIPMIRNVFFIQWWILSNDQSFQNISTEDRAILLNTTKSENIITGNYIY